MCLYPRIITNPKYKANKKNGGVIPAISDERVTQVPIGCGVCLECMKQKARGWQVRLLEDIRVNNNGKFMTMTFNSKSLKEITEIVRKKDKAVGYDLDNAIATKAVRYFLERWRKKYGKSLRHWLVTELGHEGTEHLHLHGIVWTDEKMEEIERIWQYGYCHKGRLKPNGQWENYVNNRSVTYITKYLFKIDEKHKKYKPIILCSKGIGKAYMDKIDSEKNKYKEGGTKEYYKTSTGHKMGMPIYWRNKIYSEEEREKLWVEKLDKQERYVLGCKIDISNGEEEYNKALQLAQKHSEEMGYNSMNMTWEEEQYERERRILKQKEKIQKYKTPAGEAVLRE
jgi:hypothetical protein